MIRRLLLIGVLLASAGRVSAQVVEVTNTATGAAVAVRCVTIDGTAFESCAGAGGNVTIGMVDQGASGMDPWAVNFLAPQHIICDSGCGTAAAVAMSDATANPTIPQTASFGMLFNGTTWDRWKGDATNGAFVNVKNASLAVTGTFWQATQPVSGTFFQATQPVSIASMPSTPVTGTFFQATQPVSGTFWQATQPVSGTFWQATQPVSGPLTDTQIRATALPVSGTFWQATQPVSGTFWQATQPVSGTVTANAGTGNFTVVQPTGSNLHIQCDAGCGGAAAFSDNAAFTFGTTSVGIAAATVDDTGTRTVTENSAASLRMTPLSGLHVNLRNQAGAEIAPLTDTQLRATPVPVSGTVTTTPPANASTNVAQLAGTATSVNSGVKDAGTLRVVLATDQPALTNKLLVTPDSVALPANQSVNVAQVNGVATSTGVGASGTGTIRTASVIHDGTDTAQVTATSGGSLQVECAAGCGSAATSSPASISVSESVAAPFATTWYVKRRFTPPANSHFIPSRISSTVTTAGTRTLVTEGLTLATWNENTNAFTDGSSVAAPRHFSRLFAVVTTTRAATANTITVTYTDELGNTGNSATCAMPATALTVGSAIECGLAVTTGNELDAGVRDVTAVADSAAPATGIVALWGMNAMHDAQGAANAYEMTDYDQGEIPTTETVFILFFQAAVTAQQRAAVVFGSIR